MAKTLSQEVQELIDEVTARSHPGESFWLRANHLVREFMDVFARWLDAVDDENQAAELSMFRRDISDLVEDAIDKTDVRLPPMVRPFLGPCIQAFTEWIVEESTESGQSIDQFCKTQVVPLLKELDKTILLSVMRLTRK